MYATAKVGGNDTPTTNTAQVTMPANLAPTLISATETGATSGCATAVPPLNTVYDSCTFTFSPRDGSAPNPVTSTVAGLTTCVSNLNANTNYDVSGPPISLPPRGCGPHRAGKGRGPPCGRRLFDPPPFPAPCTARR